ncbi:MAG: sigma 54-interacting transcriptional regulator [Pyrinomonadaceae bacterium]|nr:sigma 54-interacting transcriptional regulator [Pyrinomonadaceae bacterium]
MTAVRSISLLLGLRLLLVIGLAVLISPASLRAQLPDRTYRILVLYWDNKDFPGNVKFDESFKAGLQLSQYSGNLEYYPEYMETTRFPGKSQDFFRDYLRQKYEGRPIDVVVATADIPLSFLLQYRKELFPNSPIVFLANNSPSPESLAAGPGVTGIIHQSTHRETLALALKLHPNTKQVFVISGSPERDKRFETVARRELSEFSNQVEITYLTDLPLNELISRTASLPSNSIAMYVWQQSVNDQGKHLETYEVLAQIAPAASVPIYGMGSGNLGQGLVGGYLQGPDSNGAKIAEIALRILSGTRPQDIAVAGAPTVPRFDWRQLKRWGINESSLPPGSTVSFRQLTLWDQYKWYVIGIIAAFLMETLLVAWLLFMRARRRQAELESVRLASVAEAERRRLDEVVSNVPGVVWEARLDAITGTGKPTFISEYVQKILGYSVEEFLSTPGLGVNLVHEEDRERVIREGDDIGKNGGLIQFRWIAKDGRVVWAEAHLAPILDETGAPIGVRGVTLDVTERKIAEVARKQSEERNRAILQAIPDQMFLQTRDGVYLDYHGERRSDLVMPADGLIGRNMRDVLPPELARDLSNCFERAEENEAQIVEYRLPFNGDDQWFEARVVRSGENFLSVVRDVTARKSAENALKQNEAQLAGIISSAMDGIITINDREEVVLFNAAAEKMFSCSADKAIGKPLEQFIPQGSRQAGKNHVQLFGETNLRRRLMGLPGDLNGLRGSGEKFPIDASTSQVELNGHTFYTLILRDISERKIAEEALRQSEAKFRNMADTAPVMIWVAGSDKLYTYFNQQWLTFTGRTMQEELGLAWAEDVHPDDHDRCLEIYDTSFDERKPFEMEYRLRRADGEYRWVIDCGTPRFSSNGEFLGYIGSSLDITERKHSEVALQIALEELHKLKIQLEAENIYLQQEIQLDQAFGEIIGKSDPIKYVLSKITQVAPTDAIVLLSGETGTGKELVARAIHGASTRKDRPLIKVNCAALSASLIESELFGHEKGSFTGAAARKLGRFELADGGTIFLDEIGELPLELQVKLLRVLQEGEFERVGGSKTIKVDVRIIAATNRNLKLEVDKGSFREDLWYRLNVFPITVPPLRQHKEDIALLVDHFANKFANKLGRKITSVSPRSMQRLEAHSWPGNIRELANVIERAVIHTQGPVLHLADSLEQAKEESPALLSLDEMEREYIIRTLENTGWRVEGLYGAAKILGLNASTLRARMSKLGIQRPHAAAAKGANDAFR